MKKIVLLFILLFGIISISNAQLGVRAGLNISDVSYSSDDGGVATNSLTGFHIGVVNTFNLSEKIDFRPGILYSAKGFNSNDGSEDLDAKFGYFEVPLDFVYNASGVEGLKLNAGPYVGILTSAKVNGIDFKDDVESLDFGINVGLGYRFGDISIGAQYGLGMAELVKDNDGGSESAKNTNISFYGIYHL
jgi:hypothetical protein